MVVAQTVRTRFPQPSEPARQHGRLGVMDGPQEGTSPDEVADAALFLASSASAQLNATRCTWTAGCAPGCARTPPRNR
jgi:hypothetical protein